MATSTEEKKVVFSAPTVDIEGSETIEVKHSSQPSWAGFVPGPLSHHRAKRLSPAAMRYGVTICGCCVMMLSGYSKLVLFGCSALDMKGMLILPCRSCSNGIGFFFSNLSQDYRFG